MKKAIRICLCLWMGFSAGAWGQTVYYVNSKASASNTGGTQAAPFNTVYKALNKANAGDTIKVAVGLYPISTDRNKGGEGSIVVGAGITVRGGYASTPQGGVASAFADNPQDSVNQTIFMGDSTCRIATVAGTLEKVTLRGGKAIGGNGGGAYVKGSGELRNCIVRDCIATPKKIKVGDILLQNGEVTDVNNYDYVRDHGQPTDVVGVVFWVNPDRTAANGILAKAMSIKEFSGKYVTWGLVDDDEIDRSTFESEWPKLPEQKDFASAMIDYDGERNTDSLLSGSRKGECQFTFPPAENCRSMGARWYLPSLGEYELIQREFSTIDDSFNILWTGIMGRRERPVTVMRDYFGRNAEYAEYYGSSNLMLPTIANVASSSNAGLQWMNGTQKRGIWVLMGLNREGGVFTDYVDMGDTYIKGRDIRTGNYRYCAATLIRK